jgi:hypothetical protein
MADVFLSYASEDRDRARSLAGALETRGWSVWWDRKIVVGQTFDQIIEHELDTAKSVVVLWSRHSITSEWVKNEAAVAAERGMLVPALIDEVKPPLPFRFKQTADLVTWNENPSHEGFQALCEGIAIVTNSAGLAPVQPNPVEMPLGHWKRLSTWGVITATVAVLSFWAYLIWITTISPPSRHDVAPIKPQTEGGAAQGGQPGKPAATERPAGAETSTSVGQPGAELGVARTDKVILESAIVVPYSSRAGDTMTLRTQYAILDDKPDKEVRVTERRAIMNGSEVVKQLSARTITRNPGTWVSEQSITTPSNLPKGKYVFRSEVEVEGVTHSLDGYFVIE